ncbi:MAG: glycosyltransferase family 4 protein [Burkholderiaceae bacterium]|jgi:glycosyltransferase involved in cell wall biosynthesis|nr:glycosyltransferase family 4 protein [Burkholderiales bacterium]MCZ8104833.1 glycosyltransferase family 4 protein [Burkholderiales bacterium]MCZ8336908.1 glycosyltransferase family 4 protein [Burkholderiaceae bacterium]
MKVVALGLRALPGIAGGVESHCEHLYPHVADIGVDVEILVRSAYVERDAPRRWRGTRIRHLWSPRKSGYEVIIHTFLGVLYAAVTRPDIVHIHSVGPAVLAPVARLFGLRVLVTHHAPDYMQAKWGWLGKWTLKTGEKMGMRWAHEVISVSRHGVVQLKQDYGREPVLILNGVPLIEPTPSRAVLDELGLESGRYVLHVGRGIPDKRQDDLIEAFVRAKLEGWKLVMVGNLSGTDEYCKRVRELAFRHEHVVLAGFRSGVDLQALFTNAGLFALPSAIEGLSIALLEALSAGCAVVGSDIPANHEIELPAQCYFPVGDVDSMARALCEVPRAVPRELWDGLRRRIHAEYDWVRIAEQTVALYHRMVGPGASVVPAVAPGEGGTAGGRVREDAGPAGQRPARADGPVPERDGAVID